MADNQGVSQVLPSAPPPPQEVKVRTLKSDLASIAASGGGLPRYQNVRIAQAAAAQKGPAVLWRTIAIVGLAVIIAAIVIYFVVQAIFK